MKLPISSLSFLLSSEYNYKIKFLGIHVANCNISITDSLFQNTEVVKLNYKVITKPFINNFFKVDNFYTIIIDKKYHNTLYYRKKTSQPNLTNFIETEFIDNKIRYKDSDIFLKENDVNIFTLLYLISNKDKKINKIKNLEREGKYYNLEIFRENQVYRLFINEFNDSNKGLIEHTDIFLWALFLPNTSNSIKVSKSGLIQKCTFRRGLLNVSAEIY